MIYQNCPRFVFQIQKYPRNCEFNYGDRSVLSIASEDTLSVYGLERKHLRLCCRVAHPPIVLVAVDVERHLHIGVAKRLGKQLSVDAVVEPGLGKSMAKRMEIVPSAYTGALRQPVDQLPNSVGGQSALMGAHLQGVGRFVGTVVEISL